MSRVPLEQRVEALEVDLASVKAQLANGKPSEQPWWEANAGTFANDPLYRKAMKLGREYRESLRPKPARPKTGSHGRTRHGSR